jgi:hypothetical protein
MFRWQDSDETAPPWTVREVVISLAMIIGCLGALALAAGLIAMVR